MKTVVPGYIYELASHKPNGVAQVLEFVHKSATAAGDHTLQEVEDGTTTEEVIMVLMDRLTFLNAKLPSAHNSRAIFNLRRALDELHARTTDRVKRGVGNPCPLLLIGIPSSVISFDEPEEIVQNLIKESSSE